MAAFAPSAFWTHPLDVRLAVTGPVTLHRTSAGLERDQECLQDAGYRLVTLDFPDYCGADLDALADCLSDVVTYEYGASESDTGLVLSTTGYGGFAERWARSR